MGVRGLSISTLGVSAVADKHLLSFHSCLIFPSHPARSSNMVSSTMAFILKNPPADGVVDFVLSAFGVGAVAVVLSCPSILPDFPKSSRTKQCE
jgi:hypothetical protein